MPVSDNNRAVGIVDRERTREPSGRKFKHEWGWRPEVNAVPLYLQLANLVSRKIVSGELEVGSLLPTEMELCARLSLSRQTVRQAIDHLRRKEIVSTRRGVGTRVDMVPNRGGYRYAVQSIADLFDLAVETELHITSRSVEIASGRLAKELGCRPGKKWRRFSGLRYSATDRSPISWVDAYLDFRFQSVLDEFDVLRSAVFSMVERDYGEHIVEVRQDIRGALIDAPRAEPLGVRPGDLGLLITRRYLASGGRLILYASALLPSDRHAYTMTFRAD